MMWRLEHPTAYILFGAIGLILVAIVYVLCEYDVPWRFRICVAVGVVTFTLAFVAWWHLLR
jgi:hypothetical protein